MLTLLAGLLTVTALILCVPVIVLAIEIIAAIALKGRSTDKDDANGLRPRVAVLIPAHDEGAGLLPTITDVKLQLGLHDRVIVVADNCTDNTAKLALRSGAEVVERQDRHRFGKGYALDRGLRYLQDDPPDIVIIIDADCRLSEQALDKLALSCAVRGQPTQALYHMKEAPGVENGGRGRVAQFAWIVKTEVRPLGLAKLGLPCQLMGTGMAFPWKAIRCIDLASGNLVEDVKLGLDLAVNGMAPYLCRETYVESTFPSTDSGRVSQRRRWEVGSLRLLVDGVLPFLWKGVRDRNFPLLGLALDALVPPLAVLTMALVAFLLVATSAAITGIASLPLVIVSAALILFAVSIGLAWAGFARSVLRLRDAGELVAYLRQKVTIYRAHNGGGPDWTRTDRR